MDAAGTGQAGLRDQGASPAPGRLRALALAAPLILFILLSFVAPIGSLLLCAVSDSELANGLPRTALALQAWQPGGPPPGEAAFEALALDLAAAQEARTAAALGKRLNFEWPGARSLVTGTAREAARWTAGPYQPLFLAQDERWNDPALWAVIARAVSPLTPAYLLAALDLRQMPDGGVAPQPEDERIYAAVYGRTLEIALTVTLATLLLGYPVAWAMAAAPPRISGLIMMCVLLPFWTSLLVRTTAWVVLLQTNGVINDLILALGLTSERLELIYSRFGTVVAMTHIQLPLTILPIYAVMKGIDPRYWRAARSLGAGPMAAFLRVYFPLTLPGVAAGALLTFILSLGYYITPALVGGPRDQMISNFVADFINRQLNWGMAAALSAVLLLLTLSIYILFVRLVGTERIKLG